MKMQMNKIRTVDLFKTKNKTYTILDKQKKSLICKIVEGFGAKKTATSLNLSIKSLKRWMKNGIDRKKGGGRKIMDKKQKRNIKKQESAITLIALVVTIVVLIILAGISISSELCDLL